MARSQTQRLPPEPEKAGPAPTPPQSSGGVVTVGCKLPHGLIMRVYDMVDTSEPVSGGGMRNVPKARRRGGEVVIRGTAVPFGKTPLFPIVGGYALTEGVDADFWDLWVTQNQDSDIVRNNLVFAQERTPDAIDRAKEQAELRSGLEPMNMVKDPRSPKPLSSSLSPIEAWKKE